jgi:N-acetylmuramoyl-L-alanine amidase
MDTTAASQSYPSSPDSPGRTYGSRMTVFRALQTVFSAAFIVATLFTIWTPTALFSNTLVEKVNLALEPVPLVVDGPTPTPLPARRVGIVAGHWGNDSGAVCADGVTEADVNLKIATLVSQQLNEEGYEVDLLKEFDHQLMQYQALLLVSIHNDSCNYVNDEATGFKVSAARSSAYPEKASRLTACLVDRYAAITGMAFHYNSITPDMTDYHAFEEINTNTTAAIIETGFLNLDRQILTERTDVVAQGITSGILCYLRNESVAPTPIP